MLFINDKRNLLLLATLIMALFAMNGCSSDDDPTTPTGGGSDAPEFSGAGSAAIDLPAGLESSNDPNAQALASYMTQVNTLSGLSTILTIPAGATQDKNKDGSWQYTWEVNDSPVVMSITLTIVELADRYTWTMRIDGFDGEFTYNNDIVYFAEWAKDDSFGSFLFYDVAGGSNDVVFSWEWATDDAGVFTMTMIAGDDVDGAKIEFVVNPDGSGTLDIYEIADMGWQILVHYEWDAAGNGSWIVYEDGQASGSGNWIVGGEG